MATPHRFFTLGRPLDPTYWSNRIVLLACGAAVVTTLLYSALSPGATGDVKLAIQAVASLFIPWAMARELDPDNETSALCAMIPGAALFLLGHPICIAGGGVVLLCTRALNGSTGYELVEGDIVVIIAAAILSARYETPLILLTAGVTMLLTEVSCHQRVTRIIGVMCATLSLLLLSNETISVPIPLQIASLGGLAIYLAWAATRSTPLTSGDDRGTGPMQRKKVTKANAVAIMTACLLLITRPGNAYGCGAGIVPAAVAIAGCALGTYALRRVTD